VSARLVQRIVVADGAVCEWLPQESIVFDGALGALETEVALAGDAGFIGSEMLCFGRTGLPAGTWTFAGTKPSFVTYRVTVVPASVVCTASSAVSVGSADSSAAGASAWAAGFSDAQPQASPARASINIDIQMERFIVFSFRVKYFQFTRQPRCRALVHV
jgi:hypothetical protein